MISCFSFAECLFMNSLFYFHISYLLLMIFSMKKSTLIKISFSFFFTFTAGRTGIGSLFSLGNYSSKTDRICMKCPGGGGRGKVEIAVSGVSFTCQRMGRGFLLEYYDIIKSFFVFSIVVHRYYGPPLTGNLHDSAVKPFG